MREYNTLFHLLSQKFEDNEDVACSCARATFLVTTVMTAPYLVYFVFVPREASNSSEVKIWGCCCPETVFGAAP
jgi:hypothetical protein